MPDGFLAEVGVIGDNTEQGGSGCTFSDVLWDEEEFLTPLDDLIDDDRSGLRVGVPIEVPLSNSFIDKNDNKVGCVGPLSEEIEDAIDFIMEELIDLPFTDTISVDDDGLRSLLVAFDVLLKGVAHEFRGAIDEFLSAVVLDCLRVEE